MAGSQCACSAASLAIDPGLRACAGAFKPANIGQMHQQEPFACLDPRLSWLIVAAVGAPLQVCYLLTGRPWTTRVRSRPYLTP
jgi:hypothetical protein